ncbi:MAG: hypothetical protein IPF53_20570 [Blastocatellia bacterium]|nr:hypothetical protein [Blastocatellia bacterium]
MPAAGCAATCLAYMSVPVFQFSTSRAGDYIDQSVASVVGEATTRVRVAKEESFDLRRSPQSKIEQALSIYYEEMILSLVEALRTDFVKAANLPRMDRPIPIVLSGGTASPKGFVEKFVAAPRAGGSSVQGLGRAAGVGSAHRHSARLRDRRDARRIGAVPGDESAGSPSIACSRRV